LHLVAQLLQLGDEALPLSALNLDPPDAYGNVATGYTGTVQFSSSDSLGILPGNYIFTAGPGLDNGVHTFTVTLSTVGSQWLTASDTAASSITGTQTGIVVAAAAP